MHPQNKFMTKAIICTKGCVELSKDTRILKSSAKFQRLSLLCQRRKINTSQPNYTPGGLLLKDSKSNRNNKLSNGHVAMEPIRYGIMDIMKVFLTCTAGLTVGASISKRIVSVLEEYELFVLEDDDDEEDDDDD